MIYNTTINAVNESEFDTLLENAEDRFEYETMAEAAAIVIAEQEQNWTKFMKGVGLSELASIIEGEEVIYEGARLQKFVSKAKAYFQMALNKLAEITKSFIAKIDQFLRPTDSFIKKYESQLKGATVDEFKGYEFSKTLDNTPVYKNKTVAHVTSDNASKIISDKDEFYSAKAAQKEFGIDTDGLFITAVTKKLFGEKKTLNNINVAEQISVLKSTKDLKTKAKNSYKSAAKEIKNIIKELKNAEKEALKSNVKDKTDLGEAGNVEKAYSTLITYWKAYSSCALGYHMIYMRALGARNRQAKAICTKAITKGLKAEGKAKRETLKAKTEGYVETDAFLDAVDFI